jgi:hypothetical protein
MAEDHPIILPEGFSKSLWVRVRGYEERLFLGQNPHLINPGRMVAWSPEKNSDVRISRGEITEAPPNSQSWVEAYLIGSEHVRRGC